MVGRVAQTEERLHTSRVSWGAIFAGAACAIALQAVFLLFAVAMGLEIVDDGDLTGFGVGTGLFILITSIMCLFAGGSVAGRLSGEPFLPAAVLHGAVVWALVTIVGIYAASAVTSKIASAAGATLQTAGSAVGGIASGAGQAVQAVVPDLSEMDFPSAGQILPPSMEQDLQQLLQREGMTPEQLRQEVTAITENVFDEQDANQIRSIATTAGRRILQNPQNTEEIVTAAINRLTDGDNAPLGDQKIDRLAGVLQQRTGISETEARQQVDKWLGEFQQAREEAISTYRNTVDDLSQELNNARQQVEEQAMQAADAASSFAFWSAIALIFGLGAACVGAAVANPEEFDRLS